ncbi:Xaa-Pro peptidase family protein [Conexibacter sp. CPCC 206217]|uniref:M24 family metallopeptidase n=1 Tax=Conexibacter sp. CPCC 206217 TaxID=3064574 RepID=UPI002721B3FA|nr:Xaa-Pro peptidase family protein [Conexibacter sp. CPCC 206217]MDO8212520.1 Xaa-Pro peptidase family protein [Conexibacter sp. CPCC 206217]
MTAALFDREELIARADRAREEMARAGLDALVVTGDFAAGMNYYYLSGHLPRDYQLNYSRPHVMVLPREGEPLLWVYGINEANARVQSWVQDVVAYGPPFSGAALADAVRARGLGRGRIGAEFGTDQRIAMPFDEWRAFEAGLPGAEFVDGTDVLWALRMIKSPAEVEWIRKCDTINGEGLANAFGAIVAGDSEVDVGRKVGAALVEAGAFRPPYAQALIVSEAKAKALGHTSRMLGPQTDQILKPGELLFVDSGVTLAGYWGEFNRMAVVGEPSAEQTFHHDNIREIVRRSIAEALKPGESFRAVMEHMVRLYHELGYGDEKIGNYLGPPYMHLCHGLGIASSEPPFVRLDSDDVLLPGMVLSCEAYLPEGGMTYGSEEDVLITADGCEVLSEPDPGLYVMGA